MTRQIAAPLVLMFVGLPAVTTLAQDAGDRDSGDRGGRRFDRGPRGGGPPGGRGFRGRGGPRGMGPPRDLSPEERWQMYDFVAQRQLERFTDDYGLTAEQQDMVRARLDELKTEQWQYAEPRMEQFRAIRQEMHDAFEKRREGGEIDEDRMEELRDKMRDLWQGSPLMNPERSAEAIEPLLPEEQVAKARQRQAERRAEWERRRESWRARRQDRDEGRRRDGPGRFGDRGDRWDRYVEDFIRRYQIDASQQATADSILRTLKDQRDRYREKHQADFDALDQIDDRSARREAYQKLNEPVEELFNELRDRLGAIPTTAQVKAAEARAPRPTSRPASATSRPAGATSRPAGDRGSRGFGRRPRR